ncbi:MAG: hypothetical protein AAF436_15740 [Myxococcota bacterium]
MQEAAPVIVIALMVVIFSVSYASIVMINKRGDEAVQGIVRGEPISLRTRRMVLLTHYLPLASFLAGFLFIMSAGLFAVGKQFSGGPAGAVAYMGAVLCATGAVTWIALGGAWVVHTLVVLREAERDPG